MRYLITGAGSGIGRAVARLAVTRAEAGETIGLALVDRNQEALDEVAEELTALGARCVTVVADLADTEAPGRAVQVAQNELGALDAVISNAGTIAAGPLADLDVDAFQRNFAINTQATWLLAQAARPTLRETRGALVATASMSAQHPTPPLGAYSASKAALVMLVRQLALEWGPDGIRCNCVSPGPTDTGLTRQSFGAGVNDTARANRAYREALIPLRKIGGPEEVAEAIIFLASPRASQITGVDLLVDGGLSLSLMPVAAGISGYVPNSAATDERGV
ncbi:SDR family oxidoreductase [Micromonospora zingiberis]|uniref:SDR family oxidoreductase n=1 Tax=Micromonospora zingiberis TaxID=2053011 RepID=A0A4R0GP24_9ACTN|nr:SDR family oxidoreductase [Micromonospora zingiberis]TCB97228.1 SDR family oxidoreductase [Micromonospora zingiberis]